LTSLTAFHRISYRYFSKKTGKTDPSDYFEVDTRVVGCGPGKFPGDHARYHPNLPQGARIDEWGVGHLPTESGNAQHAHLEGFLYPMLDLHTPREANEYPLPDVDAPVPVRRRAGQVRKIHERGICAVAGLECTIFEIAWYMRSMELLLIDFVDNPDFARTLLDRITDKRCAQARYFAKSGVDILRLGDDIASQRGMIMRPSMWRSGSNHAWQW